MLLLLSFQTTELERALGILEGENIPCCPKFPCWFIIFEPEIQIQLFPSYFQKSFRYPEE